MKVNDALKLTVWIAGRRQIRLLDLMEHLGISYQEVGFPRRIYHDRRGSTALICGTITRPCEEITLDLGSGVIGADHHEFQPRIVSREPLPYMSVYGPLYEYERGQLSNWAKRRRERGLTFPRQRYDYLFEVLGPAQGGGWRVKLPHQQREWVLRADFIWLDRRPTPLELRLRELALDNPYHSEPHHPLYAIDHLLEEHALKERWLLCADGTTRSFLAIEEWEWKRSDGISERSCDEALIAIQSAVGDHGRTHYSGLFESQRMERYWTADWSLGASEQLQRDMTDLHTIENEMIRSAMRAVAETRRYYAQATFDRLMGRA